MPEYATDGKHTSIVPLTTFVPIVLLQGGCMLGGCIKQLTLNRLLSNSLRSLESWTFTLLYQSISLTSLTSVIFSYKHSKVCQKVWVPRQNSLHLGLSSLPIFLTVAISGIFARLLLKQG